MIKTKTEEEIKAFMEEILAVCKKHGIAISHEDGHGSFEFEVYDQYYENWFRQALDQWRSILGRGK